MVSQNMCMMFYGSLFCKVLVNVWLCLRILCPFPSSGSIGRSPFITVGLVRRYQGVLVVFPKLAHAVFWLWVVNVLGGLLCFVLGVGSGKVPD